MNEPNDQVNRGHHYDASEPCGPMYDIKGCLTPLDPAPQRTNMTYDPGPDADEPTVVVREKPRDVK